MFFYFLGGTYTDVLESSSDILSTRKSLSKIWANKKLVLSMLLLVVMIIALSNDILEALFSIFFSTTLTSLRGITRLTWDFT